MAISSWLHGLNTSLGTGFENISHILSGGYKRKFTDAYRLKVKRTHADHIESIIRDLKAGAYSPNPAREDELIFASYPEDPDIDSLPFTVDTFIEKEDEIIAIELKSVRPNSGEGRGEKQKILYGKAALKAQSPGKRVRFLVGFPFDPTSSTPTGFDKTRFFDSLIEFKKFFGHEEILIASEFWDFLSGEKNTMEEILDVVGALVTWQKGVDSSSHRCH